MQNGVEGAKVKKKKIVDMLLVLCAGCTFLLPIPNIDTLSVSLYPWKELPKRGIGGEGMYDLVVRLYKASNLHFSKVLDELHYQ